MKDLVQLTQLEKEVLAFAFFQGFAFDDLEDNFICYEAVRDNPEQAKKDRGALSSLVKKGIITIWIDKEYDNLPYTSVADGYTKRDLLKMCEFDKIYPNYGVRY